MTTIDEVSDRREDRFVGKRQSRDAKDQKTRQSRVAKMPDQVEQMRAAQPFSPRIPLACPKTGCPTTRADDPLVENMLAGRRLAGALTARGE